MRITPLVVLLCLLSSPARAETLAWALLPARGENPPPTDPTLLRLTTEIGQALHKAVGQQVRVVSRNLRDDACPATDGQCPHDVAILVDADHVVSLNLAKDFSTLQFRVYGRSGGLEREFELSCQWAAGRVGCETEKLKKSLKFRAQLVAKEKVEAKFERLRGKLKHCRKQGLGDDPPKAVKKASVRFRIDGRGRAAEVRIDPKRIQSTPAYQCMARVVEGLTVGGPTAEPAFRFPLPTP